MDNLMGELLAGPTPQGVRTDQDQALRRISVAQDNATPSTVGQPTPAARAQSAPHGRGRRGAGGVKRKGRNASPPPSSFDGGSVYTELCEFQDFASAFGGSHPTGGAVIGAAVGMGAGMGAGMGEPKPRRRRARSAKPRASSAGRQSPPSTAHADDQPPPPKVGGYLVGLRNYRDTDLNPYLAEPTPMLMKPVAKLGGLGGKLGKIGAPSAPGKDGKDGPAGTGLAAQLLHEQQLRILSSLYGAPLRCFGVPPTSAPSGDPYGLNKTAGARGPAAGTGLAVVKEARAKAEQAAEARKARLDEPALIS